MCMFSAPKPAPVAQAKPIVDDTADEEARKKALIDAKNRRGLGSVPPSQTPLGSKNDAALQRPRLLGQTAGIAA